MLSHPIIFEMIQFLFVLHQELDRLLDLAG